MTRTIRAVQLAQVLHWPAGGEHPAGGWQHPQDEGVPRLLGRSDPTGADLAQTWLTSSGVQPVRVGSQVAMEETSLGPAPMRMSTAPFSKYHRPSSKLPKESSG